MRGKAEAEAKESMKTVESEVYMTIERRGGGKRESTSCKKRKKKEKGKEKRKKTTTLTHHNPLSRTFTIASPGSWI